MIEHKGRLGAIQFSPMKHSIANPSILSKVTQWLPLGIIMISVAAFGGFWGWFEAPNTVENTSQTAAELSFTDNTAQTFPNPGKSERPYRSIPPSPLKRSCFALLGAILGALGAIAAFLLIRWLWYFLLRRLSEISAAIRGTG